MVVLREILLSAVRAGDPLAAWSAAARLLRWHYPLITPSGQNGLANSLANSADRLPSGTRCADPALPFVRYVYQQSTFLLSGMFCLVHFLTIMIQPNLIMSNLLTLEQQDQTTNHLSSTSWLRICPMCVCISNLVPCLHGS